VGINAVILSISSSDLSCRAIADYVEAQKVTKARSNCGSTGITVCEDPPMPLFFGSLGKTMNRLLKIAQKAICYSGNHRSLFIVSSQRRVSRFDEQKLLVSRAVGNLEPIPLKPKKELTERGLVSACDVGAL
jgi:hypothetical protein